MYTCAQYKKNILIFISWVTCWGDHLVHFFALACNRILDNLPLPFSFLFCKLFLQLPKLHFTLNLLLLFSLLNISLQLPRLHLFLNLLLLISSIFFTYFRFCNFHFFYSNIVASRVEMIAFEWFVESVSLGP